MSRYVDNCEVGVEPMSDQERHDLKKERDDAEYTAMYETVRAERESQGMPAAPIMVAAEAMRRLRTNTGKAP